MQEQIKQKHQAQLSILLFYTFPIVIFCIYSLNSMSDEQGWLIWSFGLLLIAAGSVTLMLQFARNRDEVRVVEKIVEKIIRQPVLTAQVGGEVLNPALQVENETLKTQLQQAQNECLRLETEYQKVYQEYQKMLEGTQEHGKKKDILLAEYAQTVNDLRKTMETKQKDIDRLEKSVNDLNYDLTTLLKLNDYERFEESPATVHEKPLSKGQSPLKAPPLNPSNQLKKCINIAQKLTSSAYFGASPYQGLPLDHGALDQRRLYDSFQSESACVVAVYSRRENRLVFVNDKVTDVLGWSSDKFIQSYSDLIVEGLAEWQEAIQSLLTRAEAEVPLLVRAKDGKDYLFQCHMGTIPSGVFKNQIVAIFVGY